MGRDVPPTLFITMHRLDRNPQEISDLLLGLIEPLPEFYEFPALHIIPFYSIKKSVGNRQAI